MSLSSRIALALAVILLALGYRLHKQEQEIALLKSGAASGMDHPSVASLAEQGACAKQAALFFHESGFDNSGMGSYENHYSPKSGRCFILMSKTDIANHIVSYSRDLSDVFENKIYGELLDMSNEKRPPQCYVNSPTGQEQSCSSSTEFEHLASAFMRD